MVSLRRGFVDRIRVLEWLLVAIARWLHGSGHGGNDRISRLTLSGRSCCHGDARVDSWLGRCQVREERSNGAHGVAIAFP